MPAGEKNLSNIIGTERIAGKDWNQLKVITTQLALSIKQLHNMNYIHGDIKPFNVIRLGSEIKLIDLDACAKVGSDYYGSKYSQAYVPPEFLYKIDDQPIKRIFTKPLRADYSQDSWSLGMLLYELYTGMSFLLKDSDDGIDTDSLELLYDFDDDMKQKKLSKISDRLARNLVSLLLDKDPSKRLSMSRLLEHPFLSGKSAVRLVGEEAEYDMFISYRVDSDLHHAEKVYDILTSHGLKVWFDKKSLLPGMNWEEGFSDGLVKSRSMLPIISRNSLNNSSNPRSNVTLLDEDSPCDNVLVEYELALELKERG
jgi:serine/threonine protein kinase